MLKGCPYSCCCNLLAALHCYAAVGFPKDVCLPKCMPHVQITTTTLVWLLLICKCLAILDDGIVVFPAKPVAICAAICTPHICVRQVSTYIIIRAKLACTTEHANTYILAKHSFLRNASQACVFCNWVFVILKQQCTSVSCTCSSIK